MCYNYMIVLYYEFQNNFEQLNIFFSQLKNNILLFTIMLKYNG